MARLYERQEVPVIVVASKNTPQAPYLNPATLDQIRYIYAQFSHQEGFPTGFCHRVSPVIAQVTGLTLTGGTFKLDRATPPLTEEDKKETGHQWVKTPNGIIIDATIDQFNPGLRLWNRARRGIHVVYPGTPMYNRYQESAQAA